MVHQKKVGNVPPAEIEEAEFVASYRCSTEIKIHRPKNRSRSRISEHRNQVVPGAAPPAPRITECFVVSHHQSARPASSPERTNTKPPRFGAGASSLWEARYANRSKPEGARKKNRVHADVFGVLFGANIFPPAVHISKVQSELAVQQEPHSGSDKILIRIL